MFSDQDPTARTRLRDTAVRCFARDGFDVGLRTIAREAGVSAALVVHHFGSKDALRRACDEHVLATVRQRKSEVVGPGGPEQLLVELASVAEYAPLVAYAIRSLQSGGDLARAFVDQFAADTEAYLAEGVAAGTIRPSRDETARARYLTVMGFGAFIVDLGLHGPADLGDLREYLEGYMGRAVLPALELFTEGLLTDRSMLDAYLLYVTDPPRSGSPAEPPSPPAAAPDVAPGPDEPHSAAPDEG